MAPAEGGLKITLVKSPIGYAQRQKDTVRALGLRRLHQTVIRPDNPQMRGMVFAIQHLVRVETAEAPDAAPRSGARRGSKAAPKADTKTRASKAGGKTTSTDATPSEGRTE